MSKFHMFLVVSFCSAALAVPQNVYPLEHRINSDGSRSVKVVGELPQASAYEYHIVPKDEVAVTEYDSGFSLWDLISPTAIITKVASTALAVVKSLILNSGFILLGAASVLGFCAFTPYCTLSIHKYPSWSHYYRAIVDSNPLEEIQDFLAKSLEKYNEIK